MHAAIAAQDGRTVKNKEAATKLLKTWDPPVAEKRVREAIKRLMASGDLIESKTSKELTAAARIGGQSLWPCAHGSASALAYP